MGRPEKDGSIAHCPKRDLTFSAPKSVSLVAMLGSDSTVVAAHDAVKRTLAWLETVPDVIRQLPQAREADAVPLSRQAVCGHDEEPPLVGRSLVGNRGCFFCVPGEDVEVSRSVGPLDPDAVTRPVALARGDIEPGRL